MLVYGLYLKIKISNHNMKQNKNEAIVFEMLEEATCKRRIERNYIGYIKSKTPTEAGV